MIVDIFAWLLGWVITIIGTILPNWVIWPDTILDLANYVATWLAKLNTWLAVDTFFDAVDAFIIFLSFYIPIRLLLMLINWIRGTGKIEL